MSTSWVVLCAALAAGATPGSLVSNPSDSLNTPTISATVEATHAKPASARELRNEVRAALKRAAALTGAARENAIRDLVRLYPVLKSDQLLSKEERLELTGTVRNRLAKITEQLVRDARKTGARRKHPEVAAVALPVGGEILAQQFGPVGVGGGLAPLAFDQSGEATRPLADLIRAVIAPDNWDDPPAAIAPRQPGFLAQQIGGANAGAFGQANAQGANADVGKDLVELIQATIAPESWEVNGGNGTIMYFSPMRVLVVRQTGEVHDGLFDLVEGLRK